MTTRTQSVTTVVLAAAAVSLGGYLWFVDRSRPTTGELEARKQRFIKAFRSAELSEIAIEQTGRAFRIVRERVKDDAGGSAFRLVRENSSGDEPTDQAAVQRLIDTVENAAALRKVDPALDRTSLGLDPPRAKLTVRMGDLSYHIAIGKEAGVPPGAAYAELDADGPCVVPHGFVLDVLRPAETYRLRTLVSYALSDLGAIQIEGTARRVRLVRAPWGGFRLEGDGATGRVRRAAMEQLANTVLSLRIEKFIDDVAADTALARAEERAHVVLEPVDAQRPKVRLEIGGACVANTEGERADGSAQSPTDGAAIGKLVVVVRREPARMSGCVPISVLENLRLPGEMLVDKHLVDVQVDEIEELRIQEGERLLELVRKGTGWRLRSPQERDVSSADAKGLTEGLVKLEGEPVALTDLKRAGLDPPRGTLRVIQPASGQQPHAQQQVDLGELGPDGRFVRRAQDGVVLKLNHTQALLLEPVATRVRSATLVDVAPEQIRKVDVSFGDQERQVIVRAHAGFQFEMPAGFATDGALCTDLFEMLARLSAERWVAERDDGSFGLAHPRLSVQFEVTADGGLDSRRLVVGDRTTDGSYGRWEPDTGVFVLPRSVENTLGLYAIDRSPFMIDPGEVDSVSLIGEGRTISLVAGGKEQWECNADAGAGLSESSVARVREALIEMRAEAIVHLGGAKQSEGLAKPSLRIVVHRLPGRHERSTDIRIAIGHSDVWRTTNVHYARREGLNATYAIAASKLKPLWEAVAGR